MQFRLNKEQHKENIKAAFALNKKFDGLVKQKTVLLVDDVIISGSTMLEAAKVLKKFGAKNVWGIAFAHGN